MTKFEELMIDKDNKMQRMVIINERKAILEKHSWREYPLIGDSQMCVEVDAKRAKLIVILNVENGEVRLRYMDKLLAIFNVDEELISALKYDVLIKCIGFEIEKYDLF
ncbi:MAG: hypothetical protein ACRCXT_01145 [Paraclostridium sp.]